MTKHIYIGSDHSGYELKEKLKIYLESLGYIVNDMGAFSYMKDDDYPDFIKQVAQSVRNDKNSFGIIMGGSGQGEAICANKIKGIRAALFYGFKIPTKKIDINGDESTNPFEIVKLTRKHNDANILSLGVRFINEEEAKKAIKLFIETPFSNEERHIRRINKLETKN